MSRPKRRARITQSLGDTFRQDGLCAETDPEAFFPEKGQPVGTAKAICFRCDVQEECLNWALKHDERFGVWGGASERDREKIKKFGHGSAEFLRAQRARDVRLAYSPATP